LALGDDLELSLLRRENGAFHEEDICNTIKLSPREVIYIWHVGCRWLNRPKIASSDYVAEATYFQILRFMATAWMAELAERQSRRPRYVIEVADRPVATAASTTEEIMVGKLLLRSYINRAIRRQ